MIMNVLTAHTDSNLYNGAQRTSLNAPSAATPTANVCRIVLTTIRLAAITVLALGLSRSAYGDTLLDTIERAALSEGAPPNLLLAICTVESNLNPYVTNFDDGGANSHGLCQVQTRTARWLGCIKEVKDLYTPRINAECAAKYIKYQLKRYDHYWPYAIAAYNAGSVIKNRKGKIVNQKYVDKVSRRLNK